MQFSRMRTARLYHMGVLLTETPIDRDPPWTETPWTEPPGQSPQDRDPPPDGNPLDRDRPMNRQTPVKLLPSQTSFADGNEV